MYRQKMKKAGIDSVRLAAGVNLMPGPDIADDGDCLLAAADSQVSYLKSFVPFWQNSKIYLFISR